MLSGSLDGSFIHVAEESVLEARPVKKWDRDLCWFSVILIVIGPCDFSLSIATASVRL